MELKKRHNNVTSNGIIGDESGFKIAMNAKMFRTLSDTLYEDKIGSIVREIACNAADAHIAAGTPDLPIEIHIPNALEPWFSVKDNGVGMSDDDIRKVYTTYGDSTKDNSNDEVGAFGLGSKTPFAYTDQFTIVSIHGGMERTYVAVINNDGMPVLNMQGETETAEHPGLEVTIAVNNNDFDKFEQAIINQLQFFDVKPVLINNIKNLEFRNLHNPDEISIQNDLVTLYKFGRGTPLHRIHVVQGGVGYPLNINRLGELNRNTKDFANALEQSGAYMKFPIGQITVTASREGISYEDECCKNIIQRIEQIAQVICAEVSKKIRAEKHIWNRVVIYNEQIDVVQKALRNLPDFDKLFPNVELDRNNNMRLDKSALDNLKIQAVYMVRHQYTHRGSYSMGERMARKIVGQRNSRYGNDIHLVPTKDVNIFIRDTNSKPIARLKMFCADNNYPTTLVIEGAHSYELNVACIQKVANALGVDVNNIRKLSDLPAPKFTTSGNQGGRRPRAFEWDATGVQANSSDWTPICDSIDDIGEAVYMPMDRHDLEWNNDNRLLMLAIIHGKVNYRVIAVNQQTTKRIQDGKIGADLITVEDAINPIKDKIVTLEPMLRAKAKYEGYLREIRGSSILQNILSKHDSMGGFSIQGVEKRVAQLDKRLDGWNFARENGMDLQTEVEKGREAAIDRKATIYSRYPMLKHVDRYPTDETVNDTIEYVKMVDQGA